MSNEITIVSTNEIMLNQTSMNSVLKVAEIMASSVATIPKHLQGKSGDCFAIVLQAAQWNMNPFAVAQKTHIINGVLGYEAQLVNAVVQQSGAISGHFNYEYKGDGENLSCRVGAVLSGDNAITWGEWLSIQKVTIKNSPLWKTNPKQQLSYLQIKNWSRLYCPGSILGVYTPDELEQIKPEKVINPINDNVVNDADSSFEGMLEIIKTMQITDFKNIDPLIYNEDERKSLKKACEARRNEIYKNEFDKALQLIENANSKEEIEAIELKNFKLPESYLDKVWEAINDKLDALDAFDVEEKSNSLTDFDDL